MECATILYDKKHYFPMHLHPDRYTFSYILRGSAHLICNNATYFLKAGDVVIIPPYVAHQTLVEHSFHYKVIRVPKMHSFSATTANKLGVTIIQNSERYTNQFNLWFDSVMTSNGTQSFTSEKLATKVPQLFNRFIGPSESNVTTTNIMLQKALVHLESNYNRAIHVEELSDLSCLSDSHFQRLFKVNIGISPIRYLQNLRIEKAKECLKTRANFTEIAYDTGFFDQSHFIKYFKMNVGMLPKKYADLVKND